MPGLSFLLALPFAIVLAVALRRAWLSAAEDERPEEDDTPSSMLNISVEDFLEFLSRVRQAIRQSHGA
jgi:hypothetical protein